MNTENDLAAVPAGPPWSLDVIADLHAGVYPPDIEADLRARIAEDRDAQAMLTALGSVVDELSLLPPMRMPERYASRLDAAVAAESAARSQRMAFLPGSSDQQSGPTGPGSTGPQYSPGAPPARQSGQPNGPAGPPRSFLSVVPGQASRGPGDEPQQLAGPDLPSGPGQGKVRSLDAARRRRRGVITGLGIAAAVAAIATVSVAALNSSSNPGSAAAPVAGEPAPSSVAPNALEIDTGKVGDAFSQIEGKKQGSLSNPITFASCMIANGINGVDVLGSVNASYQGQPVLAIAVAVDSTHAEVYIVGPGCGPGGAQLIAKQQVNR